MGQHPGGGEVQGVISGEDQIAFHIVVGFKRERRHAWKRKHGVSLLYDNLFP